jgi:hypothetical protein
MGNPDYREINNLRLRQLFLVRVFKIPKTGAKYLSAIAYYILLLKRFFE